MPETFTPVALANDTGQKLNAGYFNRLETNLETFDDRIAAVELGVLTPVPVGYSATLVINASLGGLFRCTATGNLVIADIQNGVDGQEIVVDILASGADRTITYGGTSTTVTVGQTWSGRFRYTSASNTWRYTADSSSGSSASSALVHTLSSSGTALTLDAAALAGYIKLITLTANCTFTFTGAVVGQAASLELVLIQDTTGGRTVVWPSSVRWSGGAPTLSTTASAVDRIVLTSYNGGGIWYGDLIGKTYA